MNYFIKEASAKEATSLEEMLENFNKSHFPNAREVIKKTLLLKQMMKLLQASME